MSLGRPCQGCTRLLVTVMGEPEAADLARLSEEALGVDWMRPEEDEAWSLLEQEESPSRQGRSIASA